MPKTIAIEDLPLLDGEAALFDAAIDPTAMQLVSDHIIISIITNP
jgi:hypothetical protein